jgi:periplasmic protein TonB
VSDRVFAWMLVVSLALHVVGLGALATLRTADASPPAPAPPVEIVVVTPPDPPAPPPPTREPLTPPKVVAAPKPTAKARPTELLDLMTETKTPVPATLVRDPVVAALPTAPTTAPSAWTDGGSLLPSPALTPGNGGGAGEPSANGDFSPGNGDGTGVGRRTGPAGGALAAVPGPGTAGLTSFVKPLGGYQTTPRYPEWARRQGIEGVTQLRFEVLTDGRVGRVVVDRPSGHIDLDQAAVSAIKTWRFEPARRGSEAVAVWVRLPVRFSLIAP